MRCGVCQHRETKVIASDLSGAARRRRRKCLSCGYRFTTMEKHLPEEATT